MSVATISTNFNAEDPGPPTIALEDRTAVLPLAKKPRISAWDTNPSSHSGMRYVRIVPTFTSRPVVGFHLEKLQVYEYTGQAQAPLKDRAMNCVLAPYPNGTDAAVALGMAAAMLYDRISGLDFQLKIDDADHDSASPDHIAARRKLVETWSSSVLNPRRIAEAVCGSSAGYLHAWTDAGKPTLANKNANGYMRPALQSSSNPAYTPARFAWGEFCSSPRVSVNPIMLEFGNGDIEENYVAFCTGSTCAQALYEAGVARVSKPSASVYLIAKEGAPHGNKLQTEEHLLANGQYLLKKPNTSWGKWAVVDMEMMNQLYDIGDASSVPTLTTNINASP